MKIIRKLGTGQNGDIFLAISKANEFMIAVKCFKK
jgi:hypothetical protein